MTHRDGGDAFEKLAATTANIKQRAAKEDCATNA